MRLLVIGGTYNPVHIGHLFLAEEVRTALGYDKAIFIPAFIPVHKKLISGINPIHRVKMLELAVKPYPGFAVDSCEIERGGKSFSIDTIEYIRAKYKSEDKPGFLIGDDLAITFTTWKEPEKVAELSDLIVVHRLFKEEINLSFPHKYIGNLMLPVSSSEIRQRVKDGKNIKFIVPDKVIEYIEKHNLYK